MSCPNFVEKIVGEFENNSPNLSIRITKRYDYGHYIVERWQMIQGKEVIPAIFARPKGKERVPFVLYNHSHGGDFTQGKSELIEGASYLQQPSFLDEMMELGVAVGTIDMIGFEERSSLKESELFKEYLVQGKTLWGKRLEDNRCFLRAVLQREAIDENRVATIGMSMGGMMAWWMGILCEEITVVVDIAGQVPLEYLAKTHQLDRHGFYYYVPGFLEQTTTAQLQQELAAKKHLSLIGRDDRLCPYEGCFPLCEEIQQSVNEQGYATNFTYEFFDGGHEETKGMRVRWKEFLKNQL